MAGKKKNPNNKRQNVKHASLKKRFNSRIRQEYIDMDYIDELDDTIKRNKLPDGTMVTDLEWAAIFMSEWNNASVSGIKDKTNKTAKKKNKLHRTASEAKECTDRNNARNRDIYSIAKAQNMVHKQDYETLQDWIEEKQEVNYNHAEETMLDYLEQVENLSNSSDDTND